MLKLLTKVFGDANERELRKLRPIVERVNALEPEVERLSNEQLRDKTTEFRGRLLAGESLDSLLPEAFACVREAAKRTLSQRHHDVQILAGVVLHQGKIAEMKTGEGKTLVATLPLYLNALTGRGVHLVTPNDYLSRLGGGWMGPIYRLLGLSVGVIAHEFSALYDPEYEDPQPHGDDRLNHWRPVSRREAYLADITYGTNNEFGFDYLRDHMAWDVSGQVQRELHYAIVDEVDNILIDEARTPLIISGPAEESAEYYALFARVVKRLRHGEHFTIDERTRTVALTEEGIDAVERMLNLRNLYDPANYQLTHYLENALKAEFIYKLDKDYVVKDGEIVIVDEFTGRLMLGRRYSEGLHQAIEAKEGVRVQRENVTLARITFQNYFRLYEKLAGMTGTAATEADEFRKIYNLDVVVIPTHRPMIRQDFPDLVYKTERAKFDAVVEEIEECYRQQRPVLVGTTSIEKSEHLSAILKRRGIPHQVLNAKHHEREALIIAQAGRPGAVTIATNMAGRGVDILLGGNPDGLLPEFLKALGVRDGEATPEDVQQAMAMARAACEADRQRVVELGGLHIIGTERHEARRIDNQLRGRAGRQGDPGSSRFYVSLEDELMRRFGGERIAGLMDRLGLEEDVPLEHSWVTKSIENAQTKVEAYNFDIRKHRVEYDDVLNKHREVFYADRQKVLEEASLREMILEWIEQELVSIVSAHLVGERAEEWDLDGLLNLVRNIIPLPAEFSRDDLEGLSPEEVADALFERARAAYDEKERGLGPELMRRLEKTWVLMVMDRLWTHHLTAMDDLESGIGLQAYGQRDPLVMYKIEAHRMFEELMAAIRSEVVSTIFHVTFTQEPPRRQQRTFTNREAEGNDRQPVRAGSKVGRNDPCPCGSGKKYKRCHGR